MNKKSKINEEDDELLHLTKLLNTIHKEYFSKPNGSVIDILNKKKNIFQGLKFYTDNIKLKNRIEDYGGFLEKNMKNANYILSSNSEFLEEYKNNCLVVLSDNFIYESVYKLEKKNITDYIIFDFSEDQKLIDELFGEDII